MTEKRRCSIVEKGTPCPNDYYALDMCGKHYQRWRKRGDPLATRTPTLGLPIHIRFWLKVRAQPNGCWLFIGNTTFKGYGMFAGISAHRFAYLQLVGPIPNHLQLDHLCRNHPCVHPDHLEAVTHRENVLRGNSPSAITARTNVCKRGHALTPDNVYRMARGRRCATCHNAMARARRQH